MLCTIVILFFFFSSFPRKINVIFNFVIYKHEILIYWCLIRHFVIMFSLNVSYSFNIFFPCYWQLFTALFWLSHAFLQDFLPHCWEPTEKEYYPFKLNALCVLTSKYSTDTWFINSQLRLLTFPSPKCRNRQNMWQY